MSLACQAVHTPCREGRKHSFHESAPVLGVLWTQLLLTLACSCEYLLTHSPAWSLSNVTGSSMESYPCYCLYCFNKAEHRGMKLSGGLTRAGPVMVVVSNLMWLESPRRQACGHTHKRINLGGQDSFLTWYLPKGICVAVCLSVCKYPWMFQGLRRMSTVLFNHLFLWDSLSLNLKLGW